LSLSTQKKLDKFINPASAIKMSSSKINNPKILEVEINQLESKEEDLKTKSDR